MITHSKILLSLMGRARLSEVTQEDRRKLAADVGVGPEAVRHWERKRRIPRHWLMYFRSTRPEVFK